MAGGVSRPSCGARARRKQAGAAASGGTGASPPGAVIWKPSAGRREPPSRGHTRRPAPRGRSRRPRPPARTGSRGCCQRVGTAWHGPEAMPVEQAPTRGSGQGVFFAQGVSVSPSSSRLSGAFWSSVGTGAFPACPDGSVREPLPVLHRTEVVLRPSYLHLEHPPRGLSMAVLLGFGSALPEGSSHGVPHPFGHLGLQIEAVRCWGCRSLGVQPSHLSHPASLAAWPTSR